MRFQADSAQINASLVAHKAHENKQEHKNLLLPTLLCSPFYTTLLAQQLWLQHILTALAQTADQSWGTERWLSPAPPL